MKENKWLMISVFGSVLVHVLLVMFAHRLRVPGAEGAVEETRRIFRLRDVEMEPAETRPAVIAEPIRFARPLDTGAPDEKAYRKLIEELVPPEQTRQLLRTIVKPGAAAADEVKAPVELPEIIKIEKRFLGDRVEDVTRRIIPSVDRIQGAPGAPPGEVAEELWEGLGQAAGPGEGMPAESIAEARGRTAPGHPAEKELAVPGGERPGKYESMDDLVSIELFTYHEEGERKGYFLVSIKPRADRGEIEVIPKDILFVLDASASMTEDKLRVAGEALRHVTGMLNPEDRCNVIVFRDMPSFFMPQLVDAKRFSPDKAYQFMSAFESKSGTDIYSALSELVKQKPAGDRVYSLFLVSDGKPTVGMTGSRDVINALTASNKANCTIFSTSGGMGTNKYLLEFLSYRNRGAFSHTPRLFEMKDNIVKFYDFARDPVLMDPAYRVGSIREPETYPSVLPDLYKGMQLEITGRFEDEAEIAVQIIGEARGRHKEILFRKRFPERDNGDSRVAYLWARGKIYSLVSRMCLEGDSQEYLDEVHGLSSRYGVPVPY